jgi:hypothetical protein
LPSSSLLGVCSLILLPLFATGVNDTGGKFAAGVVETGGNLPPAPLTPVKFAAGIFDTGGKFATRINNASKNGGKICHRCHLDSRISPRNFEKIRNGLNGILWGWGKLIHEKKPEAKNLVTLSL